jgi:hypothetical protein
MTCYLFVRVGVDRSGEERVGAAHRGANFLPSRRASKSVKILVGTDDRSGGDGAAAAE